MLQCIWVPIRTHHKLVCIRVFIIVIIRVSVSEYGRWPLSWYYIINGYPVQLYIYNKVDPYHRYSWLLKWIKVDNRNNFLTVTTDFTSYRNRLTLLYLTALLSCNFSETCQSYHEIQFGISVNFFRLPWDSFLVLKHCISFKWIFRFGSYFSLLWYKKRILQYNQYVLISLELG